MSYVLQDPQAVLNYSHDWDTDWLEAGDTIISHAWTIEPSATLAGETTDTVFVSALALGQRYEHVVTSTGVEDERTIVILCMDT